MPAGFMVQGLGSRWIRRVHGGKSLTMFRKRFFVSTRLLLINHESILKFVTHSKTAHRQPPESTQAAQ